MNFSNLILGIAVFIALFLAYLVGEKQGLKSAPEFVAYEKAKDESLKLALTELESEYIGSFEQVCDQVFELVWDYQMETYQTPGLDRADDY